MNIENLTAKQILINRFPNAEYLDWYTPIMECMKEYAAQQVEQETKQLREERDKAVGMLRWIQFTESKHLNKETLSNIDELLKKLNQQNEG